MTRRSESYGEPLRWPDFIDVVERRLGMFVGRATYERAVSFVIGFDAAQVVQLGPRIQERVRERHNSGSLAWPGVLLSEAIGDDRPSDLGPLSKEQDARAIELLASELRAALADQTSD